MPSPLGKVSPKVTEEVRTFAKRKCIAEGDLYGNPQGIRPLPTSLRSATFPRGEGILSFAHRETAIDRAIYKKTIRTDLHLQYGSFASIFELLCSPFCWNADRRMIDTDRNHRFRFSELTNINRLSRI